MHGSYLRVLVALSTLESNKYDKVLKWKRTAVLTSDNESHTKQESIVVSEFGDLKVSHIRQPQKKLTEEETAQAIAEYSSGMTTYELADKYGCNRQTISAVLKRNGVTVTKCKALKKIDAEEVIALYEDLITTEKIAQKFGVSPQTIIKCLHSHNIKIRTRWDY